MKSTVKLMILLSVLTLLSLFNQRLHANNVEDEKYKVNEGDEEIESSSVGPDKGILKSDEHLGFQLSKEAIQNFSIQTVVVEIPRDLKIPISAILITGEEKNVYRLRDEFFKRVDFVTLKESPGFALIASQDLRQGDRIVLTGIAFLRIAEITAFAGAETNHSH